MTEFSFIVTHVDVSTSTSTVISSDVESITVVEAGTGEISSAQVRLESDNGKYVTAAGGTQIDEFDTIRIQITDQDSKTFDKVYEVHNIIPVESAQEGNVVDLECYGLEWHLQKFYFAKQFYFENAFTVVRDIINTYNDNKGDDQPKVEGHDATTFNDGTVIHKTNILPKWTANMYDFNISEKKCYDGCVDVVNRLGNTVAAGGANDFFELYFTKHSTDNTKIVLQAFPSGGDPDHPTAGSEVTITDADSINEDPTEGGIESTQGTVIADWGADDFGSQPVDASKFAGELEAFDLDPVHDTTVTYPQFARVQLNDVHYVSDINNNSSTPPTNWTVKNVRDYLGDNGITGYTPWTDGLASEWQNSGCNPNNVAGFGFGNEGCWDSNLVIFDNNHFATQVVVRCTTDVTGSGTGQIPAQYDYTSGNFYRGFRVLVDPNIAALGGVFIQNSGNDRKGKAYSKNVVQHNGQFNTGSNEFKNWDVVHVTVDDEEVNVTHEGSVYIRESGTWVDRHAQSRANHCFHEFQSTEGTTNNIGINSTIKSTGPTVTYGATAAVETQWDYTTFNLISDLILTDSNYYRFGAWLNLRFPFPHNTFNSVSTLGALWGNNTTKKEPATFDVNNMHLTHSGKDSFNQDEAEEYGPCSAITFAMNLKWTNESLGGLVLQGDFKMRCFMYDTEDNVVVSDFTIGKMCHYHLQAFKSIVPERHSVEHSILQIPFFYSAT